MQKFIGTFLKTNTVAEKVVIKALPKSVRAACLRNVDEFCAKIPHAVPILCWSIVSSGDLFLASIHACVELNGVLHDISPPLVDERSRIIVREPRMSVAKARELTRRYNDTFRDIINQRCFEKVNTGKLQFFDHVFLNLVENRKNKHNKFWRK